MSQVFDAYAAYYDLLYRDKDYAGEVDYLHALIRKHAPEANDLLELGCGTGAHAANFARLGYTVHGIDASDEMLARARAMATSLPASLAARLHFETGDVRNWRGNRQYDVVLSLFHVFSYQVADEDIRAAIATAATHLRPGGLMVVDFWYGPAVVAIQPEARVKELEDDRIRLTRRAEPESFPEQKRVDVKYDVTIQDLRHGALTRFTETHRMRYFFEPELVQLLRECGMAPLLLREWMADKPASTQSWSAILLAKRVA